MKLETPGAAPPVGTHDKPEVRIGFITFNSHYLQVARYYIEGMCVVATPLRRIHRDRSKYPCTANTSSRS